MTHHTLMGGFCLSIQKENRSQETKNKKEASIHKWYFETAKVEKNLMMVPQQKKMIPLSTETKWV